MLKLGNEFEAAQRCVEAADKLNQLIANLAVQLEQAPPEEYQGNADRARVIAAQITIGRFFASLGCRDIEYYFFGLAAAFEDLNAGIVAKIFKHKSKPKGGRIPDSSQVWFVRAGIAAAAECFLKAHSQEKKRASRQFEAQKNEFRALLRNSTDQLEYAPFNWLQQLKKGTPTPLITAVWGTYTDLIERFEEQAPSDTDWIDQGNLFLNIACRQAARLSEKSIHSSKI